MAIDTRNERFSFIGFNLPSVFVMPNPDGDFDVEQDRVQLLWLYPGFALGAPVEDVSPRYYLLRKRAR